MQEGGVRGDEDVQWVNSDARILAGVFLKLNIVMVTRTVGVEKMKSLVVSIIYAVNKQFLVLEMQYRKDEQNIFM